MDASELEKNIALLKKQIKTLGEEVGDVTGDEKEGIH